LGIIEGNEAKVWLTASDGLAVSHPSLFGKKREFHLSLV
jgi:hypothetical protein